jgi:asparagine synthase (glutamine-hydrolysing)
MCAIFGFFNPSVARETREGTVAAMAHILKHRGPDDWGQWHDASGLSLGHTRLSILDLSPLGHQPMTSTCGRYVIVFNGEIYNFKTIRTELEATGRKFRGHSDTEILVNAIAEYGCQNALKKIQGMFAFAVWDTETRKLTLARDRAGEKPLYYGWNRGVFYFASELKALMSLPEFDKKIDRRALQMFFRYDYVPSPFCILQGFSKLNPGHYLEIQPDAGMREVTPVSYWPHFNGAAPAVTPSISEQEAMQSVERVLTDVIAEQMIADVPLGAFLSGGYDSTTVVSLMQKISTRPVRTFTIGFREAQYDEAPFAKQIARHLGTAHTELIFEERDALDVVEDLPGIYDEPFSDSSQLPTLVLSRLTKSQVSVCLSGDGGDELFGGYSRFFLASDTWRTFNATPTWLREFTSWSLEHMPRWMLKMGLRMVVLTKGDQFRSVIDDKKIDKLRRIFKTSDFLNLYESFLTSWADSPVIGAVSEMNPMIREMHDWQWPSQDAMMMAIDFRTYLPDDIMVKVDRATMSTSLESRTPFLDARVVETVGKIPTEILIKNRIPKGLLKELCWKYVPKEMMERPKKGFSVPVDAWLRGELREWAGNLLSERQLEKHGLLNVDMIRQRWKDHLARRADYGTMLWAVCSFQAWYNRWFSR